MIHSDTAHYSRTSLKDASRKHIIGGGFITEYISEWRKELKTVGQDDEDDDQTSYDDKPDTLVQKQIRFGK